MVSNRFDPEVKVAIEEIQSLFIHGTHDDKQF